MSSVGNEVKENIEIGHCIPSIKFNNILKAVNMNYEFMGIIEIKKSSGKIYSPSTRYN